MNIHDYMGKNIPDILTDENKQELYRANWDQLKINYGDNVEWQRLKKQILLFFHFLCFIKFNTE